MRDDPPRLNCKRHALGALRSEPPPRPAPVAELWAAGKKKAPTSVPQRVGWGLKLSLMSTPTLVASAADDCRATDLVELLPQAAKKSKFAGTNVQCRNSCRVFRPFAAPCVRSPDILATHGSSPP